MYVLYNKSMELCGWQRTKYINNICVAFVELCHYNMFYWHLWTWKERSSVKNETYQASKKTDFTVELIWWGLLRLIPIKLQQYSLLCFTLCRCAAVLFHLTYYVHEKTCASLWCTYIEPYNSYSYVYTPCSD